MKPEQMKELTYKLLGAFSHEDPGWVDRAQDVHDNLREEAARILAEAGIKESTYDGDYDELLTELAEGVEWVPETFRLTKPNA